MHSCDDEKAQGQHVDFCNQAFLFFAAVLIKHRIKQHKQPRLQNTSALPQALLFAF